MASKQVRIAVLSGKGGTGKTLLSVNIAAVAEQATYIDCDVEEPNGYLFYQPTECVSEAVTVRIPVVDMDVCNGCRQCVDFCKFNALTYVQHQLIIDDDICHSCGGCVLLCPQRALSERDKMIGKLEKGVSGNVHVLSGFLNIGEASGVPIINELLHEAAKADGFTVVDCPPGSSCLVMESIADADYCILVAEPTLFGIHNLRMIYDLVRLMGKPFGVVINKSIAGVHIVETFCNENGLKIIGEIPFDHALGTIHSNALIAARESSHYKDLFSDLLDKVKEEVHHETARYS